MLLQQILLQLLLAFPWLFLLGLLRKLSVTGTTLWILWDMYHIFWYGLGEFPTYIRDFFNIRKMNYKSVFLWFRYTTFIVLYPIGITGELLCLYAAKLYAVSKPLSWSYTLPNTWNFTFSYHYFLGLVMLLYIPRKIILIPILFKVIDCFGGMELGYY